MIRNSLMSNAYQHPIPIAIGTNTQHPIPIAIGTNIEIIVIPTDKDGAFQPTTTTDGLEHP